MSFLLNGDWSPPTTNNAFPAVKASCTILKQVASAMRSETDGFCAPKPPNCYQHGEIWSQRILSSGYSAEMLQEDPLLRVHAGRLTRSETLWRLLELMKQLKIALRA